MPSPTENVNPSPNITIPTITAVTGSMAPSTEVSVEPMFFIALINARFDTIVGIIASSTKFSAVVESGIGSILPVAPIPANNINVPKRKT